MRKLVVANWKSNPDSLAAARRLLAALRPAVRASRHAAVFCPPAPYLAPLTAEFPSLRFGAQDLFWEAHGPHTGEVGGGMLRSCGARFVIVGHSERREMGETDAQIALKLNAALVARLQPILCVGEPLTVRKRGVAAAKAFVAAQLREALGQVSPGSKLHVAYEPVWAISTSGSGKKDSPEDAAEMIGFIRSIGARSVLYGGSVSAENATGFLAAKGINGLLVGRASLDAKNFAAVLAA